MSIYIRIKRKKQTYFLHCEPTDKISNILNEINQLNNVQTSEMRLLLEKNILIPEKTLKESKINNDSVLFLVYKDKNGWENVDIPLPSKDEIIDIE